MTAELRLRARRRAWRTWYAVRWRWWQRRDVDRVRERTIRGMRIRVDPGLFDPAWFLSSDVLVDAIAHTVRSGDRVLDLGTGTGVGALAACRAGAAEVVGCDVDPRAVRCATDNVAAAGCAARIVQGDLFDALPGERFDLIAFNPPWLTGPQDGTHTLALRSQDGLPERFAAGLADHLVPGGRALLTLSTNGRPDAWLAPLRATGRTVTRLMDVDRGSEIITAWLIVDGGPAARPVA